MGLARGYSDALSSGFAPDGFAPAGADGRRVDLRDIVEMLRMRWLVVVTLLVLSVAAAAAYLATATRIYTGVASILIDARTRPAVGDAVAYANGSPDAILVESQVRLISSDSVLRRVVVAEKLDGDPDFVGGAPGLRTRLFAMLGLGRHEAPRVVDDVQTQATQSLAPHIVVKRSERTYIADIEVTSRDPAKAARLANAVAKAYLADQQATRNDAAERDSEWVRGQVTEMQAGLQAAEIKAETYKREHGILDANGKLLNEQELAEVTTGLLQAKAKTTEAKARYDQVQRVIAAGRNPDSLPDVLKSPAIERLRAQSADISRQQATLRQTLGPRHPALLESDQQLRDVRRLIADELARIQSGIANEYQTAEINAKDLSQQLQALRSSAVTANTDRVRLDELQRDVDARRAVYERFLRARDTVKEQASDAPIGRVIAPAIAPGAPSSPKTFAVLLVSFVGGLAVGAGVALILETLWPRRRRRPTDWDSSPEAQPMSHEGSRRSPILAFVPAPFGEAGQFESRHWLIDRMRAAWPTIGEAGEGTVAAFDAAVAELPVSLDTSGGPSGEIVTVLITSDTRRDSRTTLALGLAEAAARQGRHALVIDAGSAGSLLRDLVAPGARAGLIDLMGTTRMCYRVLIPASGTLSVVPMLADETRLVRRLLGRDDVIHMDGLRGHFDAVFFDGPPVDDVARLAATAPLAHSLVYTAPPGTSRAELDRRLAELGLPPSLPVSAVLAAEPIGGDEASVAA